MFASFTGPSFFNSKSWRMQRVRNMLSADFCPRKRIPVFWIWKQPFSSPNIHSTSFLMDSSHTENRMSEQLNDVFIGGIVIYQFSYLLSAILLLHTSVLWRCRMIQCGRTNQILRLEILHLQAMPRKVIKMHNSCIVPTGRATCCCKNMMAVIDCDVVSLRSVTALKSKMVLTKPILKFLKGDVYCIYWSNAANQHSCYIVFLYVSSCFIGRCWSYNIPLE